MEPNLNISDRVLVIKDHFINTEYNLGDVVVFYNPNFIYTKNVYQEYLDALQVWNINNNKLSMDTAFVKRIIGLPGDTIIINKSGEVFNNGIKLNFNNVVSGNESELINYTVPENYYFLLGDNRNNSIDSRIYGSVNKKQIIGKAVYKIYPLNEISKIND